MKARIRLIILIFIIVVLSLTTVLNVYVYLEGDKYIISSIDSVPHSQVAIILGAAVLNNGTPSSVLEDRVFTAIDLYKQGKVSKILMSGANPTITNNEVNPVRKVLIAHGVDAKDIFLDHAGVDTYSTMYRAKAVFEISSAIIVTQEFHLPRALYTARSLGIDAYGLAADKGQYSLKNYLRELLSRPNAFLDVVTKRIPKYLGPVIPITSDGSNT
jgi:SanA protein